MNRLHPLLSLLLALPAMSAMSAEPALPAEPTARACWRQYLYLCGQAAQCPSEALAGRIAALQPALAGVPKAGLSLAERLSAEKWQRLAPRKLLKL